MLSPLSFVISTSTHGETVHDKILYVTYGRTVVSSGILVSSTM